MRRAAIVTGGSKRIGRAICLALADRGHDVALHYRTDDGAADAVREEIASRGRRCETLRADLRKPDDVAGLIGRAFDAIGDCGVLVNNASIFEPGGLLETDEELLEREFAVNFRAPVLLSRDFARRCVEDASIINLLDQRVTKAPTTYFAYTLSKKALASFTQMAAAALAPGVRVNAICPGPILAPPGKPPEALDRVIKRVPLKRKGSPEDIARAVVALLDNTYLTGQLLFVDGGEHLPG